MSTNYALLTRSHSAIAAKKRASRAQLPEVVFDEDARRDFLTGFHKRKLAKAEAARAKAKERERQERLQARREQRQMLREQAVQNAAQVEQAYGATTDHLDEEWQGISSADQDVHERDDKYEGEETFATVTIVEDFDPDTLIHGPSIPKIPTPRPETEQPPMTTSKKARPGSTPTKVKPKERKFRYETKDARRRERVRQRARRTEKAELAGGRTARSKSKSAGATKKHGSRR